MEIHLNRDGQQLGPFTMEQIQQHLAAGSVVPTDLAWHEGLPWAAQVGKRRREAKAREQLH